MLQTASMNSTDLCATLFFRLVDKGFTSSQVEKLVKDTFKIVKEGGFFTIESINETLCALGWDTNAMDTYSLNILMNLIQKAFNIEVVSHSVN
ncbi:MAG: hypothetical protein H6680_10085 [Desulfobacteraceae bacterium]|nr:hypothetical protein [Desulfobacteraceae bacterium]